MTPDFGDIPHDAGIERRADLSLVEAVCRGEEGSWERFRQRVNGFIHAYCRQVLPEGDHRTASGNDAAEEATSQVFARMKADNFAVLRKFDGRASLKTYLVARLPDLLAPSILSLFDEDRNRAWRSFECLCKHDIIRTIARRFPTRAGQVGREGGRSHGDLYQDIAEHLIKDDYRRIRKYGGHGSFIGYIRKVAENLCYDILRSRGPGRGEVELPPGADFADPRPTPEEETEEGERRRGLERAAAVIRGALAALPPDEALCLTCRFYDGMKPAEIAKLMRRPVAEIYQMLSREKVRLAGLLKDRGGPNFLGDLLEILPGTRLERQEEIP